jgi:hypothetical protein
VPLGSQCQIVINFTFPKSEQNNESVMPFTSMANFVVKTVNKDVYWMSPEKLIYHYLRDALEVKIDGAIPAFLKYKVHYIGKAT